MENLILRKATPGDSGFAFQAKKAAFGDYVAEVWGWNEEEQLRLHETRFASQDFRVVRVSGIDVGILAVVRQADCIRVNQVFIMPEHQNKGIGKACMECIIEEATVSGRPVRLQVLKVNVRAIEFFRRLGFRRIGESDNHLRMERPL